MAVEGFVCISAAERHRVMFFFFLELLAVEFFDFRRDGVEVNGSDGTFPPALIFWGREVVPRFKLCEVASAKAAGPMCR